MSQKLEITGWAKKFHSENWLSAKNFSTPGACFWQHLGILDRFSFFEKSPTLFEKIWRPPPAIQVVLEQKITNYYL